MGSRVRPMSVRDEHLYLANAAEYYVAAKLSELGYEVAMAGGMNSVDMVAINPNNGEMVPIEVKNSSKGKETWHVKDIKTSQLYIFVRNRPPDLQFFVVTPKVLIHNTSAIRGSKQEVKLEQIAIFENRWDLVRKSSLGED